jgi:hypothetical protein
MVVYSKAAVERAMKVQEVILRAMARKVTWWQAAEIIGISDRQMRRWRERLEEFGYEGLLTDGGDSPPPSGSLWRGWSRCWGCIVTAISI